MADDGEMFHGRFPVILAAKARGTRESATGEGEVDGTVEHVGSGFAAKKASPATTSATAIPPATLLLSPPPVDVLERQPGNLERRQQQIGARTDGEAVAEWLGTFEGSSPRTLEAYSREAERFLLWAQEWRPAMSLRCLLLPDVRAYEQFLRNVPASWISDRKRGRSDPEWRPFTGSLSPSSLRYTMLVLRAMMLWLQAAGYASTNPFEIDKRRFRKPPSVNVGGRGHLSPRAIEHVFSVVAEARASARTVCQHREAVRGRFLVSLYYDSALRLFEPVQATLGAVEEDEEGYWLHVVGKGGKAARVPLSPRTLEAFDEYRVAFGLPAGRVNPGSAAALLAAVRGAPRGATSATIGHALRNWMQAAAVLAAEAGDVREANALVKATPHWLRHARVSHLLKAGANVQDVRQLARHKSLDTTSEYSHAEAQALQRLVRL